MTKATREFIEKAMEMLEPPFTENRAACGIGLALLAIASEMKRANDFTEKMMADLKDLPSCSTIINGRNSNSVRGNPPPPDDEPRSRPGPIPKHHEG